MMRNEPNVEMVDCSLDGPIRKHLEESGVTFEPIAAMTANELKKVIDRVKPDVIHAHDMRAGFVAAKACGKIPLISHIHNNAFDSRGVSVKSIAYLFAAAKAKHIFWVSESSYNGYCFHKLFSKKSSVLYNIIDTDQLHMKMQEDTTSYVYDISYIGRLAYPKNPQRLIHVLEKVIKKSDKLRIAIVGTGELESETKALCEQFNLQNNITFLGFQNNPLKILHDSKLMVMTSRWEGTPMCALEAMALGVPIVSTPTDGLKDLISNGYNGFLSNNDEMLAKYILDIVENEELHKSLSENTLIKSGDINNVGNYRKSILNEYISATA